MKKAVWLSFDLGLNGDYEGMYTWLANHEATECGDNVGYVLYDCEANLLEELKNDISQNVDLAPKSRIYLIYPGDGGKMRGRFLFGKRRQAPWTGYGSVGEEESVDEL